MVGDKERDLEAGRGAGVPGLLIPVNGSLLEATQRLPFTPEAEAHV
jgi:phosphoglycolate phosphatase-like HAD superfamily hydrolase